MKRNAGRLSSRRENFNAAASRDDQDLSEAAYKWIARRLSGAYTKDADHRYEYWLSRHPKNRRDVAEIESTLERIDKVTALIIKNRKTEC